MIASRETGTRILAISLDFDGCLFNSGFYADPSKDHLINANKNLIEYILKIIQTKHYDKVIFLVGSARQSKAIDDLNSRGQYSCFSALREFCHAVQKHTRVTCEVCPYLLSDSFAKQPYGINFQHAVQGDKVFPYAHTVIDQYKLSMLYAQTHYLAKTENNARIDYHFIDNHTDILEYVKWYSTAHPFLTPKQVSITTHQYAGKAPTPFQASITGVGVTDEVLDKNLRLMASCCNFIGDGKIHFHLAHEKGISHALREYEKIRDFKRQRILAAEQIVAYFNITYENFLANIKERYNPTTYLEALDALALLKIQINAAFNKYYTTAPFTDLIRDTIQVLEVCQEPRILENQIHYNDSRQRILHKFIRRYSNTKNIVAEVKQSVTLLLRDIFHAPATLPETVTRFALSLKTIMMADEEVLLSGRSFQPKTYGDYAI